MRVAAISVVDDVHQKKVKQFFCLILQVFVEDRVLHPGYDYLETAISMETGLHFSVIKILICLEKPNCVVLAEHGILLNQSVKVSIPLS